MVLSDSDVHSFLEIKNVSHAYGHKPALENVSLDAQKSEVLALLGPSGSGKSTLLAAIAGIVKPNDGKIFCSADAICLIFRRSLAVSAWCFKISRCGRT